VSPVFAHGQLRLYLLSLLDEAPRHGYEVIRALEERFEGMYSPSAGTVYPRLARLEEEGLVVREDEGRKAVYRITPAGRAEIAGRRADVHDLEAELTASLRRMAEDVRAQVSGSARDLRDELAEAAKQARRNAREPQGAASRAGSRGGHAREAEAALDQFRSTTRVLLRRSEVTAAALSQVQAALEHARAAIEDAVTGRSS
jgi:DNA-binding PadR family transcriptional regulator